MLEWLHANKTYRKFLETSTSQALQAALSMATQPQWRESFPRPSGIRLYGDDPDRGLTLAMQETVVLALVSSTLVVDSNLTVSMMYETNAVAIFRRIRWALEL